MSWLFYVPYNTTNKDRARENRKNQTEAELKMRNEVLRKRQTWYLFLRQKMINSFILDFYCSKLLLWIEIDGSSHYDKKEYDIIRTEKIGDYGIKIIRYTNKDVMKNIEWVRIDLMERMKLRSVELNPPSPLCQGGTAHADEGKLPRPPGRTFPPLSRGT